MRAMVIGATGATGKDLVDSILKDDRFSSIIIFTRKKSPWQHEKLTEHIIDFEDINSYQNIVEGDVFFSSLGTTLKDAGGKEKQWKIDYDFQFQFAKIAKEKNIERYVLVSSAHASSESKIFYSRMKGQLEEDVKKLNFNQTIIFNPPSLIRENSTRKIEKFGVMIVSFLNKIGIAKAFQPLHTKDLALAMINSVFQLSDGEYNIQPSEIRSFL